MLARGIREQVRNLSSTKDHQHHVLATEGSQPLNESGGVHLVLAQPDTAQQPSRGSPVSEPQSPCRRERGVDHAGVAKLAASGAQRFEPLWSNLRWSACGC